MVTVKRFDLENAFEFVSSGLQSENNAYVCLDSGKIFFVSPWEVEDEDIPHDIDDATKYAAVPHKNDLDLGRNLVFSFIGQELADDADDVRDFFRKRGAYARFKDLLARRGMVEKWYAFEQIATEKALREWCEENDIGMVDD